MISITVHFDTAHPAWQADQLTFEEEQGIKIMDAIKLYDRLAEPVIVAWIITLVLVGLLLSGLRDLIIAFLEKCYEVFIQRSPFQP